MSEHESEDMKSGYLTREYMVSFINRAYNDDVTRSYKDYKKRLDKLSDEALHSILRVISSSRHDRDARLLVRQFSQRSTSQPENIARFATLIEQEYFSVKRELNNTYGITPSTMEVAYAVAGVIAFEDQRTLSREQQHNAILVIAAAEAADSVETSEWLRHDIGRCAWINEEAFTDYLFADHTDGCRHSIITAICSGRQFSRFLEVIEIVNGASKPLITGVL